MLRFAGFGPTEPSEEAPPPVRGLLQAAMLQNTGLQGVEAWTIDLGRGDLGAYGHPKAEIWL